MKVLDHYSTTAQLTRIVILTAIVLGLALFSFASYYYWDRYVHLGDESPISKSISELETTVRKDPSNTDARMGLAETYLLNKRYDEAINQAQQVLAIDPHSERGLFVLGLSLATQKKYEAAEKPLLNFAAIREKSQMVGTDSALETALYHLGVGYLEMNKPDEAVNVLERAVKINMTDADAFFQLGRAYARTSQDDKALESYQKAILFVPDFTEAYQGMTETYTARNQPQYAGYARGMVAFSQKDYANARSALEKAVTALPDFVPALIGLGLTYEEQGDLQLAKTQLERAAKLEPDNFAVTQALGRVLSKIK